MNTITAWRITAEKYLDTAFSGRGAEEYGGRFNRVGTPLVYASESLSLATLELLAQTGSRRRLRGRVAIPVTFSDDYVAERTADELPEGWDQRPYGSASQEVGEAWIESEESLVLRVPSVVVPVEHNYLINPQHPDVLDLETGEPRPLNPDPRLPAD